jgi:hypothetical protein
MKISKVHTILIIAILLFGGVLFSSVLNPVSAQTAQPTGTPTPNPTIVVLEERVEELEKDVALLNDRKDIDRDTLQLQIKEQLLPITVGGIFFGGVGISTIIGLWMGYRNSTAKIQKRYEEDVQKTRETYNTFAEIIKQKVEEDTRKTLDRAFYNADPLYYPLYVPASGFDLEIKKLQKLGFKNLLKYGGLREGILNGVIIVRIPGENFRKQQDVDLAEAALNAFEKFVNENKAYEKKIAFVLYITGGLLEKANEVTKKYDNIVIANMPVTVAGHVYALVRGLTAIENNKEDA